MEGNLNLVDLTHEIVDGMIPYPGDPATTLKRDKLFKIDGYTHYTLSTSLHTGTHMDVPMHMTDSQWGVSSYALDLFFGTARVFDVRGVSNVHLKDFNHERIQQGDIVLFCTGQDRFFGEKNYFQSYPTLTKEVADFLVDRQVKMVGIDSPSPDYEPYPVHQILLRGDVMILENLTRVYELLQAQNICVYAFPLKLYADASLVRAVATWTKMKS